MSVREPANRIGVIGADNSPHHVVHRVPGKGTGERLMTLPGAQLADLQALLAAIKRSPIVARLSARFSPLRDWATIRKSSEVDAYVLAWIASHARRTPRRPRFF